MARFVATHLAGRPPVLASNSFLVLRAAAVEGVGCMVMPCLQGRRAGLVPLPVDTTELPSAPTFLLYPASLRKVPRIRAVVDAIEELMGDLNEIVDRSTAG